MRDNRCDDCALTNMLTLCRRQFSLCPVQRVPFNSDADSLQKQLANKCTENSMTTTVNTSERTKFTAFASTFNQAQSMSGQIQKEIFDKRCNVLVFITPNKNVSTAKMAQNSKWQ